MKVLYKNKWVFATLIASAVFVPVYVVHADSEQSIANGTYDVNFFTYKTGTTETSGMSNRFSQPAKLIVENGEAKLQFNIVTQNGMMGNLTIPYKGKDVSMTTINGTITDETRIVELPIENFNKAVTVNVDVVFPGSNTPVKQTFDLIVESPIAKNLAEEVAITAYKKDSAEVSVMQQFLKPTASIHLDGNESIVHITILNKEYVNELTINGEKADSIIDEKNGAITYGFKVKNTKALLNAIIDVDANGQQMTQQAHLHLAVKGAPVMIANPFTDIEQNENKEAILNLLNKGIVKPADKFNPHQALTRSQFALMIARTLNLKSTRDAGFADIASIQAVDTARYDAINALAEVGIVKKADKFNPNATITRQQAALMIYRAMQYHVGTDALDFGKNMSVYADGAIITNEESQRAFSFLYASGAMTGSIDQNGKRMIDPNKTLTRGQMAKVLNGTLKYLGH